MGWKKLKEHYRIGHIVQVYPTRGICIGSPYINDLIVIGFDGTIIKRDDGRHNAELRRYMAEFDADPEKLREIVSSADTFERSLPVFTYSEGEIIERRCEEYGWPNPCHTGEIQFENTHSKDKLEVVAWAKRDLKICLKWNLQHINDHRNKLAELEQEREQYLSRQASLDAEYPDVHSEKPSHDED